MPLFVNHILEPSEGKGGRFCDPEPISLSKELISEDSLWCQEESVTLIQPQYKGGAFKGAVIRGLVSLVPVYIAGSQVEGLQ